MKYLKSSQDVQKNTAVWSKNLVKFEKSVKRRTEIGLVEEMLNARVKMPHELSIIGRYLFLAREVKSQNERRKLIVNELKILWEKLNFPRQSERSIVRKVDIIINKFHNYQKKKSNEIDILFAKIFDITNVNGSWLSSEDKKFYEKQVASNGTVGYTTGKLAQKSSIHPSKRKSLSQNAFLQPSVSIHIDSSSRDSYETSSEKDSSDSDALPYTKGKHRRQDTTSAVKLVRQARLSTKNASKVLHILNNEGHGVPTPSQSGVYKALYKEAEVISKNFKESLKNEQWCLHFDGKNLEGERQVIVLKNKIHEIRLAVVSLVNSKADTIFSGIMSVLQHYGILSAIKMIVCDTTNTNTGAMNGVVVKLQANIRHNFGHTPQYIGCHHHVLDRVLRHAMDSVLVGTTSSPNISYPFITQLINDYEYLKNTFSSRADRIEIKEETVRWRDDMQFLNHLSHAFCYYVEHQDFPKIKFRTLPSMSNARWNSRAIYALLAFILIPTIRSDQFFQLCSFIAGPWCNAWFLDQRDWKLPFLTLKPALRMYPKAEKCFDTHWKKEDSLIDGVDRSNRCAERAIQVLQELFPKCNTPEKLNKRFLLSNDVFGL